MQQSFVFSGFGGQGVMFVGQLLAYTAMDSGLHVTWIPSYGPEMRGGTAHCFVMTGDKPIGSPIVSHPDVAVVFNKPSFDKYESLVAPGGLLVVNTSLVDSQSNRTDIQACYMPASDIAAQLGNSRLMNVVLLGALLRYNPVLTLSAMQQALEVHMPAHRRHLLTLNSEALVRGWRSIDPVMGIGFEAVKDIVKPLPN